MAADFSIHTMPRDDVWVNLRDGSPNPLTGPHSTQDEAVQSGRDTAKAEGVGHVIHNADGTILQQNSYGNDTISPS